MQRTSQDKCLCSVANLCPTLCNPMDCHTPGFPVLHYSQRLLTLMPVEPSNYLILYCPLRLLPSIFPNTRVFSNDLAPHLRWPRYLNFSFSISLPVNVQGWFPLGLTGLIFLLSQDNHNITKNKLPFLSKDNGIVVNMCGWKHTDSRHLRVILEPTTN